MTRTLTSKESLKKDRSKEVSNEDIDRIIDLNANIKAKQRVIDALESKCDLEDPNIIKVLTFKKAELAAAQEEFDELDQKMKQEADNKEAANNDAAWERLGEIELFLTDHETMPLTDESKKEILCVLLEEIEVEAYLELPEPDFESMIADYSADVKRVSNVIETITEIGETTNPDVKKALENQKNRLAFYKLLVEFYEGELWLQLESEKRLDGDDGIDDGIFEYLNSTKKDIICPTCKSSNWIVHVACGAFLDEDDCPSGDAEYACNSCSTIFEYGDDNMDGSTLTKDVVDTVKTVAKAWHSGLGGTKSPVTTGKATTTTPTTGSKTTKSSYVYKNCTHLHQEVKLPDGTIVHCTAAKDASKITTPPGFGLYADSMWLTYAKWRNEFISWPDGQIPRDKDVALVQIEDALKRAQKGEDIDLGCIGAHGRTGTILAIMYLIVTKGKKTPEECMKFVWENYCEHAIETKIQEWYISYASGVYYKTPVPEKPATASYNYNWSSSGTGGSVGTGTCTVSEHVAMWLRGHNVCANKKVCLDFNKEITRYLDGELDWAHNMALLKLAKYEWKIGGARITTDKAHQCTIKEHFAMFEQGVISCGYNTQCAFWEADIAEYNKKGTIQGNKCDYTTDEEYAQLFDDTKLWVDGQKKDEVIEAEVVEAEVIETTADEVKAPPKKATAKTTTTKATKPPAKPKAKTTAAKDK